MGTLIDSNVLIAWERNQLNLEDQLADPPTKTLVFRPSPLLNFSTASIVLRHQSNADVARHPLRACYRAFPL